MSTERVLEIYSRLLANYALLGEQLQELEELLQRPEARSTNRDGKFQRLLQSKEDEFNEISNESARFCDEIDTSPLKERCYILFKDGIDDTKGFKLPETAQEFLDYILDYAIQSSEMALRRAELILHETFPTLTGTNFELQEEFEITMEMIKDNSDELDEIYARWKNRDGTIRFTIDGNVSNPVHSSKEVGEYMWALIKGYNGYMRHRHEEIFSALEQGKVVVCRLCSRHTDIIDIDETLYRRHTD